ncbi:unnamed protein product, partial [Ectocarpus sp. 12 AP-2014]
MYLYCCIALLKARCSTSCIQSSSWTSTWTLDAQAAVTQEGRRSGKEAKMLTRAAASSPHPIQRVVDCLHELVGHHHD